MYISQAVLLSLFGFASASLLPRAACPNIQDPGPGSASVYVNRSGNQDTWPWLQYKSEPDLNPPFLDISKQTGEPLSEGSLFIAPYGPGVYQPGPMIVSDRGDLIWKGPDTGRSVGFGPNITTINNLGVQTFNKVHYLTYWEGATIGVGFGAIHFLNSSYHTAFTICPKLGLNVPAPFNGTCQSDMHEQLVTQRGTLLVTAYNSTPADLTAVDGPKDGWIWDAMFFELSIPDGNILYSWSSHQHQPTTKSRQPLDGTGVNETDPWDYFHINAVEYVSELDAYLVNSRHTWSTLLVDAKSKQGNVIWQVDGETGGDFGPLPANGTFRWQHDARTANLTKDGVTISWFNNYNNDGVENGTAPTNGLAMRFALPPSNTTSSTLLEHLEVANEELYSGSQGCYRFLPDGPSSFQTQFMAYGQTPVLREYGRAPDGSDLRWEATFGGNTDSYSYRGYKQQWRGRPTTSPKLTLERNSSSCPELVGYASWNGATEVTGWAVYEGGSGAALHQSGTVPWRGFETSFTPSVESKCVQVAAVVGGQEVRRSSVVCS